MNLRKFRCIKRIFSNSTPNKRIFSKISSLVVNEDDFGFAFNDSDLSDRILHLKIVPDDQSSVGVQIQTLYISSLILASKSPFFYRKEVTLTISPSEEVTLMELLHFMYRKTLRVTSAPALLDVLMAADKYEVKSCMAYCVQQLIKCPMSLESARSYLKLPSSVVDAEIVQPLIDASKRVLIAHYKDFTKSQDELMHLPLHVLEVVLGGDGLQVGSEDDVFDFILKWARARYSKPKDRREVLTERLARFMNLPYMSCSKLNEVLVCPDFDNERVSKLVLKALCPKTTKGPYRHLATNNCNFPGRTYNRPLVSVLHLETPWPHCVVYFDLKKHECANLFPSKEVHSQDFLLGGRRFCLRAKCTSGKNCFGLFLVMRGGDLRPCKLNFEFGVMKKSSKKFNNKWECNDHDMNLSLGWSNIFGISWTDFMGDNSEYFIDGVLHLRAEVIIHSKA